MLVDCGNAFNIKIFNGTLYVFFKDENTLISVRTDDVITQDELHVVDIVIDGEALICYTYVDGVFMDGQTIKENTWKFLTPLKRIEYDTKCEIDSQKAEIKSINIYKRVLKTYEIIGNYRYGEYIYYLYY